MLIEKPLDILTDAELTLSELQFLLNSSMKTAPVCGPACDVYTEKRCDKNCEDAASFLSSDIDYPLEEIIAPLAFEIKRMGVYEPCWSCEGHLGLDGELWKLPMVWFYTNSMTYVRVMSQAIKEMYYQKKISNEWIVVVTHSNADNAAICFSLEPDKSYEKPNLESLQQDVKNIADLIVNMVGVEAQRLSSTINK